MKQFFFGVVLAVGGLACGSAGANNVAACKAFLNNAKCGTVDLSGSFACDSYQNTTCDISAYFDCATSHYVCTNGSFDSTKMSNFAADCASKAVCK